jgi:hypothetical protein
MAKLTPDEQASFIRAESPTFFGPPAARGVGADRRSSSRAMPTSTVKQALIAAWRNTAPKRMLEE